MDGAFTPRESKICEIEDRRMGEGLMDGQMADDGQTDERWMTDRGCTDYRQRTHERQTDR